MGMGLWLWQKRRCDNAYIERDELRAERDQHKERWEREYDSRVQMQGQRDEARAERDEALEQSTRAVNEAEEWERLYDQMKAERDEALRQLEANAVLREALKEEGQQELDLDKPDAIAGNEDRDMPFKSTDDVYLPLTLDFKVAEWELIMQALSEWGERKAKTDTTSGELAQELSDLIGEAMDTDPEE